MSRQPTGACFRSPCTCRAGLNTGPGASWGSRRRLGRGLGAAVAGIVVVAVLAGCGADLSKQNFQRSTVPMDTSGAAAGDVPAGPIDDPAVRLGKLRTVAPCDVLDGAALDELGDPIDPEPQGWSECRVEVTDPGGKTIRVGLILGKGLTADAEDAGGAVSGLPMVVDELDENTCFVNAMTSKDPAVGVTAQVEYTGGRPCRAGRTVLGGVVDTLHDDPPTRATEPDSLADVDPCTTVTDGVAADIVGAEPRAAASSLHGCVWRGDDDPTVRVDFRVGYPTDEGTKVDLGNGVSGYSEAGVESVSRCTVRWQHRSTGERTGELVRVRYENIAAEPKADRPCAKASGLAERVVQRLPATA